MTKFIFKLFGPHGADFRLQSRMSMDADFSQPLTFYLPKRNTNATIRFSVKNSVYLASVHGHTMQFKRFMVAYNCMKYDTQKMRSRILISYVFTTLGAS